MEQSHIGHTFMRAIAMSNDHLVFVLHFLLGLWCSLGMAWGWGVEVVELAHVQETLWRANRRKHSVH